MAKNTYCNRIKVTVFPQRISVVDLCPPTFILEKIEPTVTFFSDKEFRADITIDGIRYGRGVKLPSSIDYVIVDCTFCGQFGKEYLFRPTRSNKNGEL